ncbi:class I SAM-dependent methyltransferase [Polymorphospora sp. NPDC050346]|uniref:class I SAM-dependent methyltransferase n=1 Tax=Polymorphospora sp. NPDC050346 TaxID=3155780 RepID=UPI0033CB4BCA
MATRPLHLLPRSALLLTGPVDHPDWNYRPLLGRVQQLRFRMILDLLGDTHHRRILEIGYGSGVFLPELARRCDEIHGVDIHPHAGEVTTRLAAYGVAANLAQAGAEDLPYDDGHFDCVVAVSTLECVPRIDDACREIRRVLAPGGTLVMVTPGVSPLWDLALRMTTRVDASLYGDGRQRLRPALDRHFRPAREIAVPRVGGRPVRLYTGLRLEAL